MRSISIVAVALALFLVGCTPAPATTPTPVAEAESTTVAQWASVVAESKATFEDWYLEWDAMKCSVGGTVLCSLSTLSGTFVSQTVSITLAIPQTKTAISGYLSDEPPAEIRDLYTATRAEADELAAAGQAWSDTCNAEADKPGCDKILFDFGSAASNMAKKFAAWAPYF
jgi:hypothetical protein